jgi:hypothetical protein
MRERRIEPRELRESQHSQRLENKVRVVGNGIDRDLTKPIPADRPNDQTDRGGDRYPPQADHFADRFPHKKVEEAPIAPSQKIDMARKIPKERLPVSVNLVRGLHAAGGPQI